MVELGWNIVLVCRRWHKLFSEHSPKPVFHTLFMNESALYHVPHFWITPLKKWVLNKSDNMWKQKEGLAQLKDIFSMFYIDKKISI